jgi:hypothetical protein
MSHWAEIDEQNKVVRVLVCDDNDPNGDEGYQWLMETFGGHWIKCSYNTKQGIHILGGTPLRANYPGYGWIYNEEFDIFTTPQPYPSWNLNTVTGQWQAPTPYPSGDGMYQWVEDDLNWQLVESGA